MPIPFLSMFMGAGSSPYEHKSGETFNYADVAYRQQRQDDLYGQRAKSPRGVSDSGWNREAALAGRAVGTGSPAYTRRTYPLGRPSQALWDKYGRWGEQGPQGNIGWKATLTQAPASQSTSAPSQMFKQEVFQTRETRVASGIQPYQVLHKHSNTPRLNPNLAYMFKPKNTQLGAVRRVVTRLF